jgi:hypothetical protein
LLREDDDDFEGPDGQTWTTFPDPKIENPDPLWRYVWIPERGKNRLGWSGDLSGNSETEFALIFADVVVTISGPESQAFDWSDIDKLLVYMLGGCEFSFGKKMEGAVIPESDVRKHEIHSRLFSEVHTRLGSTGTSRIDVRKVFMPVFFE